MSMISFATFPAFSTRSVSFVLSSSALKSGAGFTKESRPTSVAAIQICQAFLIFSLPPRLGERGVISGRFLTTRTISNAEESAKDWNIIHRLSNRSSRRPNRNDGNRSYLKLSGASPALPRRALGGRFHHVQFFRRCPKSAPTCSTEAGIRLERRNECASRRGAFPCSRGRNSFRGACEKSRLGHPRRGSRHRRNHPRIEFRPVFHAGIQCQTLYERFCPGDSGNQLPLSYDSRIANSARKRRKTRWESGAR